jgi:urea transport system ATP-binding protein
MSRIRGLGLLLVEQYAQLALRLADPYAVMDAGRVVASGATSELHPNGARRMLAI